MFKEYKQLNDLAIFGELNPDTLTKEEERKALRANNLIKGRTVAGDGRLNRKYVPREEATSRKIALESLLSTLIIDARKNRAVQTYDVPGAYLHADLPKEK